MSLVIFPKLRLKLVDTEEGRLLISRLGGAWMNPMMLNPRMALNICLVSTALCWVLLVLGGLAGTPSPLGFGLVTLCIGNTMYLYWRYKGMFW